MRILKLAIWDLDETILTGVLEEGDELIDSAASNLMARLRERGTLQALATYNQPTLVQSAVEKYGWSGLFVQTEANFGPKVKMVRRILDELSISPLDAAFVDADPFERDSIAFQLPGISTWSLADLQTYLDDNPSSVTEEGSRRPEMYVEQKARLQDKAVAGDYESFLHSCNIFDFISPWQSANSFGPTRMDQRITWCRKSARQGDAPCRAFFLVQILSKPRTSTDFASLEKICGHYVVLHQK